MKAFKFTPLRSIYILFSFLATTTAALAVAPIVISDSVSVELNQPFGPYQIGTSTDGTSDAPILYNTQGLPAWLSCDPLTGEIIGDPGPTESGFFVIELSATNEDGTGTGTLLISAIDPITLPVITSPLVINATAGVENTYTITASNSPTSFSVLGLSAMDTDAISPIDPATGIFSFTPSVSGVGDIINLLIGATNSQGTDNEILQVTISPSTTAPTSPDTVTIDPTLTGNQFDPQQTSTIDVSANVIPATGSTIDSVTVYWNNPPAKPDGTPRNPIILTSLNGPSTGGEFSGTINLGFDPENEELGGGSIDLEVVAFQTNAVDLVDYTSDTVNFRVDPLLEVLIPVDNLERGPFSLGDVFASARVSTNAFSQITARISGPGIVNEVVDNNISDNPNGVFYFNTLQAIDFGETYDVTITLEDSFGAIAEETKQILITNNSGQPTATIISPTPGFTNVVFTPALFTFDQQGVRRLTRDDDGNIIRTEITYLITGVSQGQGYYPPDSSGRNMDYNFLGDDSGTANVSGNQTTNGRLENISRELTISSDSDWDGYGSSGTGFVDDSDDPGLYSRFNIAVDFSSGGAQLESFKIFVNGAEISDGNLNPNNGPLDPPIVSYPASGEGHLLPGIYVVEAQLFDADGKVAFSNPLTFEILPYEPLQITLQRYLASGASPSDPVLLNNPYTLLAAVDPINESGLVEFFESGSNDKLGDGSRVEIDGKGYYQFTHAFESPGNFEVYAQVTAIDGRITISAPVDITVITSAIPEVEITSPADGNRINPGETLEISIEASDADTDGFITSVEVINNFVSLGFANLVSLDNAVTPALGTYRFDYPTTADDIGNLNLEARATDNQGIIGFSDLVQVSVIQSDIPTATITSPAASGLSIKSGETLKVTVIAADTAPGFITSVEVFDNDVSLGLASPTGNANEYSLSIPTSVADLGTFNLQARAVDNQGNVAYSAVIDHSVVQGAVPTVSIDDPLNGEAFFINTPIALAITADEGDEGIVSVEVFSNGTSAGFASSLGGNQYEFTLTATGTAGLQSLTAVATDELGNSSTSDEVNVILSTGISPVTVINTINGAVPAVAPAVDVVDRGSIVTLEISASDSDGNVTQVEVFNGANSIGLASLVGVDTYRFDYQASSPGLLKLQVRSTDDLGNIGFSDLATVSVITGAIPTAAITSPAASGLSIKSGETLKVTVIAADTAPGFITSVEVFDNDVSLGLASPTGNANEYSLSIPTSVADLGTFNLQARAVDNQGNVAYSAVIDHSVVQGAVPTVSIDDPLNGDEFFINTPIPLTITADEGDEGIVSVEVFSNGTSAGFASSLGGNQYEFTLTATGTAGLQSLTAVATDELGNSSTSDEVNVILSTGISPVTVINTINGAVPAVAPAVDVVDRGSIVTLEISASDSDGNVTQVEVFNGANSIGLASLVGVDTYRFDYQASSPGLLKLQVRSTDDLGNIGFSDLATVSVITGAIPTAAITSPAASGLSIKSGETLKVTVIAADTAPGFITSVEVFDNDVSLGLASPTGNANEYSLSIPTSVADLGTFNLQARAVDNQGNVAYSAVIDHSVVQGAVPTVSIDDPLNGDEFFINTPIPLTITADEGDEGIVSVEVFSNGTSAGFASSLGGNQYEFTLTATGTAGLQSLTAVATDELGNSSTSDEVNVILSTGISPVTVINTINGAVPAVAPAVDVVDRGSIVTLEISASDSDGNVTQVEVFNGANSIGLASLVGVDTYRFDYQASSPGLLKLQVRSTDDLGNIGFSDLATVSVITGAIPTAAITSPAASGLSIKSGETLKVTVIAADTAPGFITSVEVFDNDVSLGLASPTGNANEYSLSIPTSVADLGTFNLQARAVDNQGNVAYSAVIDHSVVQGAVPTVSIDDPLNGDEFFINTPIPLTITADEGDEGIVSVEVLSNGTSAGFASSLGGNQYEFTLTATGTAGLQSLTAVATDELGNSSTSDEVNVILSTGISPVTVINTINGAVPAVAPAVDVVDRGSIVTLEISASDSDGNVTQVEVFNGANSIGLASLVGVDTYRFDYQASSPGLLKLQVRSTDDLGNIGFSDLATVSVITGAIPTAAITSPAASGLSIKSGETLKVTVIAADTAPGFITSVEVFDNDVSLGLASPTGNANEYSLSIPTSVADLGTFNLQARAVDNQGNVAYSAVIDHSVVQGAVPTVSIDDPLNGDEFFINTPIPLTITADEGDEGIVSVEVFSNGTSAGFASSLGGNQYEFTLTATGTAGLQSLTAVATDELGNSSTSDEVNVILSTGISPVTVINTINGAVPAVAPAVDVVDRGSIVTLEISASDSDGNVTQVEVFNGANSIGLASLVGVDTYRFDYQASSPGLLKLQVRSTDDLGNIGFSDLATVSVITGDIPFTVITSPAASGLSIKSGETLKVTVIAADMAPGFITSVEVFDNDVSLGLASPTGNANEYSLSIPTSVADLGTFNLQARAVDNQGNVAYSAVIDHSVVQGAVPTVSIDDPLNGDEFFINTPIPLTITADEGDEGIVSVEVFSNGTSAGFASSLGGNQYEFTLTATGTAGLQSLTAVATDELGNSSTSDEVNVILSTGISPVTVINTINGAVPAVAPAVDVVDRGSIVTLEISASDSDGNVTQVEVFNGANSIGLASLVGVDTYRFDYQASSPGLLKLQVRSTDDLGNIGFSDLATVSVITGAIPTAAITSPAASGLSIKSGETLKVTVIAADTAPGFITSVEVFDNDVSLGLASPTGNANEYSLSIPTSVADLGTFNLQARAVDNQGNVAYSAVIDHSVVQGAVPTVSIDDPLNGDEFFINTPIPLTITADEGDEGIVSVEVFSNGTSAGFASSLGGNQYEFTLTATGTAGLQSLTAVATDELGNSSTSDEVNVILSTGISPVTVINTINGAVPAVAPAVDVVDRGSIVTLEISASDSDGNVTQVEVFNGANSIGLASLVGVDTYRFDYQASSPGLLKLQVRSTDDLGNIGFSDLATVSVITGAIPTAAITSPAASGLSIKSGETLKVTVIAADTAPGFITSVEVFDNDVSLGLASPTGNANEYSLSIPTSVADLGTFNLQARAVDNQGNVAYSAVIDHSVVQGAVPTVSIDDPLNGDEFFINTPIPLTITADEGDEGIVSVEVFSNGTSAGFASSLGGNQYEFTLTATGTAGLQSLTAVATDELGNSSTSDEVNVILSTGISPVTVINTINGAVPAVAPAVDVVDRGSIVTLEISASDSDGNVTQVEVFNGANSIGLASLVGVDTYRFDYQASSPGLLKLQVRSTDDLGNIGFSDLATVSVITGAIPTAAITSPAASGLSIKSGETLKVTVIAADTAPGFITSVEVFDNDVSLGLASPTGNANEYSLSIPTSVADLGTFNLQARAVDNQGNVAYSAVIDHSVVQGAVPTVSIDDPLNGDEFFINTPIPLTITADEGDEGIVSVEVFSNGTSAGFASSLGGNQYEFTLTATGTAGLQSLTAVATDELGNSSTSDEVNVILSTGISPVTVINTINGAVPAVAPAVDVVDRGSIVTLEISASDSDGNVTQVEVFNGANSIGLASLVGVDTYRFDYQASSPGLLKLQVRSTDDLGNIGFSDLATVSVITGAIPTAAITSPAASGLSIKSGETLKVTVIAADTAPGFITSVEVFDNDVSLGLASPTGNANEYSLSIPTSVADLGTFNLQARAVDNQGNVAYSAVIDHSVVQGAVPTVSIDDPLNGEAFFINTPIPLTITADEGDEGIVSVEVFSNGTSAGFASSLGGNQYEFTLTATGTAGLQSLTAVATDELGNSSTSDEVNVILSTGISPVTVINTINGAVPAVAPAVDVVDRGSIVTLEISASDSDGNVTQVEVFNGANSIGLASLVGVDTYRFDYQASSPGLLKLQVRSTDDLGNIGFSDLATVSVITGAIPTAAITSPAASGLSIKSGETLKVTVIAADTAPGFITSVEVFDNDVSLGLASPTGNANEYSLSIPTSVADLGTFNLQARAVDNQGNVAYSAVIDHSVVQGAVPTVSIDDPLNGDEFFINTPIPLTITADEGDEGIVSVEVFSNGTSAGFASSLGGNQYEFTLTATGTAGLQSLTAVATDELGNSSTSDEVNVILSTGISPVTVINTINGAVPAVAPAVDVVDRGSIVTLEISASDSDGNVTQVEVFNGANSIGLASLVGVDTYRFDYQASSPGLLKLQVRSTDDLGNIGFSDLATVSVITGAIPTAAITSPAASGLSIKSGETLKVTVIAADTAPGFITSVEVFDNDVSLGLASPTGNANEYSLSIPTSVADLGTFNLQARAVDNQGNVAYSAVIDHSVVQGAVPTVSIDDPLNGDEFFINTPIPLTITADEGDEGIVSVEVFSNGTSAGFASSLGGNQYEFTLTATGTAGLQSLTAVATDELGKSSTSDEVNVILSTGISPVTVINTINGAVPAVAPAVDVVDRGSIVTLEISASDSDGNVTQVEVFNGANSIGLASLVGVDTYRFDYQASSPGLLKLQVRSTDDLGNIGFSDLATVSVITGDIPFTVITSPSASGLSIKSGETLKVTVIAADMAPGFITSVEVFDNDVSLGLASPTGNANEYSLSIPTSVADLGTFNLQARAVDNQGNVAYSAVIDHSVVQGAVPTVSIDDPLNGDEFFINTPIPLTITADEGDEGIVSVEVFSNGTSAGFASSLGGNQYEFTLTATGTAGLQSLTAVATDELGNSSTSDEVNVILSTGISPVTVIDTVNGVDPSVDPIPAVDLGSVVTLVISASDSDGNVMPTIINSNSGRVTESGVEVFNGANSIGLAYLVGVDTYRFDYQAFSPGLLKLQVRATDDLGNIGFSDLATVSVITGAIPTATITSPSAGTSITAGKNIEILVTAEDSDGQVTAVELWANGIRVVDDQNVPVFARPTGNANEYLISYPTRPSSLGNANLEVRATDNQGNLGFSGIVPINVVLGAVPQIEILSPQPGDEFYINQPIVVRARITDADGIITSAVFEEDGEIRTERQLNNNGDEREVIVEASRSYTGVEVMTSTSTPDEYQFVAPLNSPDLVGLKIKAYDDDGNFTVSREVQFTVTNGIAPDVTITAPVSGTNYARGDVVAIEIDASDSDGSISEVKVLNGTTELGTASLVSNGKYRYNYTADTVGRVNLIAQAKDDLGNPGISNIETITIVTGDIPTVTITSPAEATSYTAGDIITIDVDADDADGFVTLVGIFNGDVSLGTASKVSETKYRLNLPTSLTNLGNLQLNARATDDSGNVSISTFVEVEVLTGAVPTGSITLPDGPYFEGDMLTIDVNVDDQDGYVISVEIFNAGVSLGLAYKVDDTKYRLIHGPLTPGNLQLRALVTDDRGNASESAPLSISVNTNTLPILSIDSPGAVSTFNYGNVIPFVITASDPDGSISSVSVSQLDNGTPTVLGQALQIDSDNNDQYRYSLNTALLATAGTKIISVNAVDNRGNVSTEVVEIRLDVVPFSVNFTTPTASPYVIEGEVSESLSAARLFTVEIGGIDVSTLKSLEWELQSDDGSPALSISEILVGTVEGNGQEVVVAPSLTYSQSFEFSGTGTLTVTATNSDDVSVQNSVKVFVDLPDPSSYAVGGLEDFIYYIYNQAQVLVPSEVELQAAIDAINLLGGDTASNRAAFAATLFPPYKYSSSQYQTVALVYKTLTGQWPTRTQMLTGLGIISQDTTVQSNQTRVPLNGSITAGGTQALSFDYSEGDEVVISVTGDGTSGNPLFDPTLTVSAPDGSIVGFSDDSINFLSGIFSRDPLLSFVASQTGTYTATVGGFGAFSGDFAIESISTAIESNSDTLAARALVSALKGDYNGVNSFLEDADAGSYILSPAFVAQIYLNKHGVDIKSWNLSMLGQRLTGVDENVGSGYTLLGYQNNVVNFVADFALDVELATGLLASTSHPDGYPYSGILHYGRPNNPFSAQNLDANLSFALSDILGVTNPTATDLAPYAGMTLEEALASIFASAEFAAQFAGDTTVVDTDLDGASDYLEILLGTDLNDVSVVPSILDVTTAQTMVNLGVTDGNKVAADDDADGDGVSNYAEILLNTDPSDGSFAPTAVNSFVAQRMIDLGVEDPTKVAAEDDADGDGVSNIAEILLNTNPSNTNEEPTASGSSSIEGTDFVFEFVRLKPSLTPVGVSVAVECADETFTFAPVVDLESNLSLSADQSGITDDYERVEYRVDTSNIDCNFFRLSAQ